MRCISVSSMVIIYYSATMKGEPETKAIDNDREHDG